MGLSGTTSRWQRAIPAAALCALSFALPCAAQDAGSNITGLEAHVPATTPPPPELYVNNVAGQLFNLREGDPANEDTVRVLAIAGGSEIVYGQMRLIAQNILIWFDDDQQGKSNLPEGKDGFPFATELPRESKTSTGDVATDMSSFLVPGSAGKVREIFADGDVYLSLEGRTIFQAEKVYINVIENRRVIVGGEIRTDLQSASFADVRSQKKKEKPDPFDPKNPPTPIVIRAAEIRGVADGLYEAENARFTTSTLGKPGYEIQMDRLVFEQKANEYGGRATGYGNRFMLGDVPLLTAPYFTIRTGNQSPIPLIGYSLGFSTKYGAFATTRWGNTFFDAGDRFNKELGIEGEFEGNWFADVNLYTARGLGLGGGIDYETSDQGEKKYFGSTQFFWIYDYSGEDETEVADSGTAGNRGRFKSQNRFFLPDDYQFDTEVNYISDRGFLKEFIPDEDKSDKEPETYAYLKKVDGDSAATALARFKLNSWQTQTQYLPQFTYDVISRPLTEFPDFADALGMDEPARLYWTHRSEVALVNRSATDDDDLEDDFDDDEFDDEADFEDDEDYVFAEGTALRFDDIERLNVPFEVGIFGVDPYFENRVTMWLGDAKIDGGGAFREAMTVGYNVTTQFWRTDSEYESDFWNIHGIRHVVEPTLRHRYTFVSTADSTELVPYDSVEFFDTLHAIVPGVRNRYQTRRMTRFGPESITFLEFDVQQPFVFENGRDEDADTIGDFFVEGVYRPDLDVYLLRRSSLRTTALWNWNDGSFDKFKIEFKTEPGPDLYTRLSYSYASRGRTSPTLVLDGFTPTERSKDLSAITFEIAYQATRLWEVVLLEQFDLGEGAGTQTRIVLRRRTADWMFEFGIGGPTSGIGTGFGFTVTPIAFFRRAERDRFQTALSDGYDLTPIFDEPAFAEGEAQRVDDTEK